MLHHAFTIFLPRRRLPQLLLGMALTLLAFALSGVELYRCNHNGEVEFRQTPCPEGEQTLTEVTEQSRGMTPVEPALRLQKRSPRKGAKSKPSKRDNTERCWKTERRLEKVERRLRGGYKASQYDALHEKQEEYSAYLKRFCND
jgi:hypothetical protein